MSHDMLAMKKRHPAVRNNPKEGLFRGCEVALFQSNLRWVVAVRHDRVLVRLSFGYQTEAATMKAVEPFVAGHRAVEDWPDRLVARLRAFAEGSPEGFGDVLVDLDRLTSFQRKVVTCCRKIGFGEVLTYGQLAAKAGHHGAARAVGRVMSCNRFPIVVPCHRVISSSGGLGGFTAPDGIQMKRRLLRAEGFFDSSSSD